jgi:hypothetical protein
VCFGICLGLNLVLVGLDGTTHHCLIGSVKLYRLVRFRSSWTLDLIHLEHHLTTDVLVGLESNESACITCAGSLCPSMNHHGFVSYWWSQPDWVTWIIWWLEFSVSLDWNSKLFQQLLTRETWWDRESESQLMHWCCYCYHYWSMQTLQIARLMSWWNNCSKICVRTWLKSSVIMIRRIGGLTLSFLYGPEEVGHANI